MEKRQRRWKKMILLKHFSPAYDADECNASCSFQMMKIYFSFWWNDKCTSSIYERLKKLHPPFHSKDSNFRSSV
jgi:hypothetical protein